MSAKRDFLYFDAIGGHDRAMISGRRVDIMTRKGIIRGVTGKRAIHLMTPEDRRKVPEMHQMWIDIGAKDKKEALSRVTIGDPAVYVHGFEKLHGPLAVSRAFDDKSGAYTVNEAFFVWRKEESRHVKWWQFLHPRRKSARGGRLHPLIWLTPMLLLLWM